MPNWGSRRLRRLFWPTPSPDFQCHSADGGFHPDFGSEMSEADLRGAPLVKNGPLGTGVVHPGLDGEA
jgi:hypothetical protein